MTTLLSSATCQFIKHHQHAFDMTRSDQCSYTVLL